MTEVQQSDSLEEETVCEDGSAFRAMEKFNGLICSLNLGQYRSWMEGRSDPIIHLSCLEDEPNQTVMDMQTTD